MCVRSPILHNNFVKCGLIVAKLYMEVVMYDIYIVDKCHRNRSALFTRPYPHPQISLVYHYLPYELYSPYIGGSVETVPLCNQTITHYEHPWVFIGSLINSSMVSHSHTLSMCSAGPGVAGDCLMALASLWSQRVRGAQARSLLF